MKASKFDTADYLDSKEMIAEYLNTVLEEGNETDVINAIGHVAKEIGMIRYPDRLVVVKYYFGEIASILTYEY